MERLDLDSLNEAVLPVFASMQTRGLYIDRQRWHQTIADIKIEMAKARQVALQQLSGPEHLDLFGESTLNLDSPLEVTKAMSRVRVQSEAEVALKHYRECAKLVQTYGDSFLETIDPSTWRIHTTFEPHGTSTGRVSSHNPNIQNLPSDERFQACLIAPPGKTIVQGDYATCELRILADFSQDPIFLKAFDEDQDLHAQVARELFGDASHRDQAKAINFGIVYGMGAKSLAAKLHMSVHEAEQLLAKYFQKHARIAGFLKYCVDSAYQKGYAETKLGHRLYLDPKQDISRIAKNMPIQGTAAEIAKLALVKIHARLAEFKDAYLVNMIHDELVIECLSSDADAIRDLLKVEMESAQRQITPRVKPKAEVS
ncbi:MAG: DNA polymerase A family protein [Myxococcota bacterium]